MQPERRRAERVRADLSVAWEGVLEKSPGTVSDISTRGCFILTGGRVEPEELIILEMYAPGMPLVQLWGNVVYSTEPIGFALRFDESVAAEQALLSNVVDHLRQRNARQPAHAARIDRTRHQGHSGICFDDED